MKSRKSLAVAAGMLAVAVSINVGMGSAYAQSSDAAATTSAAPSAKSTKAANRQLAKDVRRSLTKVKGLSVSKISVRANGGAVTLAGTVPDASQIDKATEAAKGTAGVTSVKNALTIREIGQ
ncbi:transport-associated protein [Caballeronia novacaledonica]|uniref:Transport-associated protein n=1 Tax=Caballeronia novacaledonica TaxID=1544861 RepID=A0A2U3IBW8_9BURK|nr:BON domain-containing protein [Caballeronia novacaledonica]SPB17706.1 transport-associated protein [Caballeronia novacaledonica]